MATHQTLASKIFSLCCWDCEKPVVESSKVPSPEVQPPTTFNLLKTEKNELCEQNLKRTDAQSLIAQEKNVSTSTDFEELTVYNIQTGYPKKNLNRYYQEHWAFRPCLIGRP